MYLLLCYEEAASKLGLLEKGKELECLVDAIKTPMARKMQQLFVTTLLYLPRYPFALSKTHKATLLYNVLLTKVREKGEITLAMTTSGIAALLLKCYRAVHS